MSPQIEPGSDRRRPDVIVDFTVEEGLLLVTLRNIGEASAFALVTRFDRPFHGLEGRKDVSKLRLFRRLEFLPPGKAFCQLVDPFVAYLRRREPMRLTATVTYRDRDGRRFRDQMTHDLRIYQDLGVSSPSGRRG